MNRIIVIKFSVLMLMTSFCYAQKNIPSKRIERIAIGLSITEEKARTVVAAMDFNEDMLRKAIKDTLLNPKDKQQLIASLLIGRRSKIYSLLTMSQQVAFNELFRLSRAQSQQFVEEGRRKSTQQLTDPSSTLENKKIKNN